MAYNIVRLTLYALIVAIESDLRAVIGSDVLSHRTPEELLPPLVYERAHDRMRRDVGFDQEFDATLVEYLDFAECIEVLSSSKAAFTGPVVQAIKRIAKHASKLTQIRNRVMHARPLEYDDFAYITNFASELLSLPEPLFPALRQTKASIAKDPASVLSLSLEEQRPETAKASHNLPIPDFDETGFLGRSSEEAALVRLCKSSPWPVITIVGQGGMGKTALALKVAYNLIDDTDAKYDAVIWSTSKTTTLTVSDIKEIDDAIRSSIGLFGHIARTLVNPAATVSEIVEFLNSFKILLILDNLETVLDQRIRDFLCQIESSSKVLITSRVGLGELEYRFPLDGMKVDDAVALLRATAQVRRADQLIRTSNSTLRAYCSKMESNPLLIKWFVSCVQSGKRVEEVLQSSQVFLGRRVPLIAAARQSMRSCCHRPTLWPSR